MAIWHIGKANSRIKELETQVGTLTKERDDAIAAVAGNNSEVVTAAEQLQTNLDLANTQIDALVKERDAAVASAASSAKQIADFQAQLAAKDSEVKIKVSQQAANLQAALGQPAAPIVPESAKTSTGTANGKTGGRTLIQMCREELDRLGYQRKN